MYFETLKQHIKMLRNLSGFLDKAEEYAKSRNFPSTNYVTARLAPDMFPLSRQIQTVCDTVKLSAARLAGKEAPKHEDNEATLPELQARITKTIEYFETLSEKDFEGAETRKIVLPFMKDHHILGKDYLREFVIPNFYFHLCMSYALLRQAGVPVGKTDYIGNIPFKPDQA